MDIDDSSDADDCEKGPWSVSLGSIRIGRAWERLTVPSDLF